jgi:carbamoyltransferase
MADAFLGVNILHDTSAAIIVDGHLVAAVEEERFNRDRHTAAFPVSAIEYCLQQAGVARKDLRGIGLTFDYERFVGNSAVFDKNLIDHDDLGADGVARIRKVNEDTWLEATAQLKRHGMGHARGFRHHETHAACGFYLSGLDEANVLVMDGRGEEESTSLWRGSDGRLEHLESYPVSESLGHLYTYVTNLCGLYKSSGSVERTGHLNAIGNEGKTMGLSAYGSGAISLDDVLTFNAERYHIDRKRLRELDRFRRTIEEGPDENSRELAFGLQRKLEEAYLFLARRLQSLTGLRDFVLTGGVALNCNANGVLAASALVEKLFIPPAAHDAGAAIGAASLLWVEHAGEPPKVPADQVYVGESIEAAVVHQAVATSGIAKTARVTDPAAVAAEAVAAGYVTGWCQGRMEFGPRALGNRSILADPRDSAMPDKINRSVKFREPWRPFAPSVLAEDAAEWFSPVLESPYMLLASDVREDRRASVPAITHVDGSARLQTVTAEANALYHRLITRFKELTGVSMVLNTSLNIKGEPIARDPSDAIRCFTDSGLEVLVIADMVLWKDGVNMTDTMLRGRTS